MCVCVCIYICTYRSLENGDRDTNYMLTDLDPDTLEMHEVFTFIGHSDTLVKGTRDIHWPGGGSPPSATPAGCVLRAQCDVDGTVGRVASLVAVVLVLLVICAAVGGGVYRKLQFESQLASRWWRVRAEDILTVEGSERSFEGRPTASSVADSSATIRVAAVPRPQPSPLQALLAVTGSPQPPPAHSSYLAARKGVFRVSVVVGGALACGQEQLIVVISRVINHVG